MILTKTINGIEVNIIDTGYCSTISLTDKTSNYTRSLDEYISGEFYSWLIQLGFEEVK